MKRFLAISLLISLLAIILAGCSSSDATSPSASSSTTPKTAPSVTSVAATPVKQYGGTFTIITNTLPPQIGHPAEIQASTNLFSSYTSAMYERLFGRTTEYRPTPGLIQSWEIASDKKSMVWHLRQGVKFHDGTDFDANAVKYNLTAQAATPAAKGLLSNITSYEALDQYTLKVNLSQFSSVLMPGTLAGYVGYMASPTAMQKTVGPEAVGQHMVGTGPFKFVDYQKDVLLKFDKWTGYYEKGKPYLDSVLIRGCADYTTKIISFKAGDAQYVSDVRGQDIPGLRDAGYIINQYDNCAAWGLFPDSANPDSPWSKIQVRQAAQYAIDTQAIGTKLFGEGTLGTTQAAAPKDPYYVQGLDRPYDPAKAKQLLKEAGYPDGFKTTYYVDMTTQNAQNYSGAIQSYLKAVGIDVDIQLSDPTKLSGLKSQGWKNGLVDGGTLITGLAGFQQTFSEYPASSAFRSMLRPAGLQAKINEIVAESDDTKRLEEYKGLTKALFDDTTYVVVYAQYLIGAFAPQIHDTVYGKNFSSYWEPQNAWLSPKK